MSTTSPTSRPALHEELDRLPERFRAVIVLCYLEGLACEAAAVRLGLPVGTVKSRLARGRERLRGRLIRRGLAPVAGLLATLLSPETAPAALPAMVAKSTARIAMGLAAGEAGGLGAVPASVSAITRRILMIMSLGRFAEIGRSSRTGSRRVDRHRVDRPADLGRFILGEGQEDQDGAGQSGTAPRGPVAGPTRAGAGEGLADGGSDRGPVDEGPGAGRYRGGSGTVRTGRAVARRSGWRPRSSTGSTMTRSRATDLMAWPRPRPRPVIAIEPERRSPGSSSGPEDRQSCATAHRSS